MTDTEWTKEYLEHRDRAATKYFNDWSGGDAPSFRDGSDFGAAYERERAKCLVEALKGIMEKESVWRDRGHVCASRQELQSACDKAREALAKYGET